MTVDEAYALFARYGNVSSDPARLKAERPTVAKLIVAAGRAKNHVSEALVDEAFYLIMKEIIND